MKRFEALRAVLAVGVIALSAACGRDAGEEAAPATAEAERGGTAVLAELADMNFPNPIVIQGAFDANLGDIMFMNLTRGAWRDGHVAHLLADESPMALARRFEYLGPDSSALRFHMRGDLRWSDGRPITAQDVVFTYELLRDPRVGSPRIDYTANLDSVVAHNDSTVTFFYSRRYPEMLHHAASGIVPRHVYQDADRGAFRSHPSLLDPTGGKLVVSGPYMVGSWQKGQQVTLVRNPHFQPAGNLDQIVFRVIPEPTTRVVELQTGAADFAVNVPFDQVPALKQQPAVRIEREEKRFVEFIGYNTRREPFSDPEIRRALGMAMNPQAMIQALQMGDYAVPASGPYPPIFREMHAPEATGAVRHDAEGAKRILEARGWRDADGDGIREKNGKPLRFTLITNAGNQRRADVIQIIQQQLRQVGVDVQLRQMEFNTLQARLLQEHDFDAALFSWGVALAPDFPQALFSRGSPLNFVGYENPQVEQLFQQAQSQPTQEAARPYWQRAVAQINQDQPYSWLYYYDMIDGVRDRLRGMKIDTYGPYQNAWEWWIPRSPQRGGSSAPAAQGDTASPRP